MSHEEAFEKDYLAYAQQASHLEWRASGQMLHRSVSYAVCQNGIAGSSSGKVATNVSESPAWFH